MKNGKPYEVKIGHNDESLTSSLPFRLNLQYLQTAISFRRLWRDIYNAYQRGLGYREAMENPMEQQKRLALL